MGMLCYLHYIYTGVSSPDSSFSLRKPSDILFICFAILNTDEGLVSQIHKELLKTKKKKKMLPQIAEPLEQHI